MKHIKKDHCSQLDIPHATAVCCLENIASSQASSQESSQRLSPVFSTVALAAALMATQGLGMQGLGMQPAIAQTAPTVTRDSSGAVQVDRNAFDIRTGPLTNTSNIPLPEGLPAGNSPEGIAVPVSPNQLAPNNIEITADLDYIHDTFNTLVNNAANGTTYTLQSESLQLTTQFGLTRRPGAHAFGEGIEVNVIGPNGVTSSQSAFIRGDKVKLGTDGSPLPESAQLGVSYGAEDRVELRVLNLRSNRAAPSESGVYFSADGQLIVEDLQDGGDKDFNDGDYVDILGGRGEATAIAESTTLSESEEVIETPLAPETRQEETVAADIIEHTVEFDTTLAEEREWGQVELADTASIRLGHADGALTAAGEQLVYNRYAAATEVRAGSDGIGITGQLSPLVNNPNVPPTLLSGNLTFNPTVGDNQAGLSATVGITQFFHPTHRLATDVFGNPITNPDPEGPRLVEPIGLFNNRRIVGYVPPTPDEVVPGAQLSSTSGIFDLPSDLPIVIEPADPQKVGRGDSAYTDNVGGLLIERQSGDISFVPQWTADGYAQTSVSLAAGEAQRIIYALVPQQAGQNLQLGESYAVTAGANGYQIADGDFSIISADRQPQNFVQEMAEVYAVEDTVSGGNAATALFNGIQGVYAEQPGGPRVSTVDVALSSEADARVGNSLYSLVTLAGDAGQSPYARTTRAAGFYVGGSLSGGLGNQRDTISQTNARITQAASDLLTQRTLNTYVTPLLQRETISLQTAETTQRRGTALFDINSQGELDNVRFSEEDSQLIGSSTMETGRAIALIRGEESLVNAVTSESMEALGRETIESDVSTNTRSEAYPNFSAVQGELALGGVFNFGNTPWTAAANTLRAELFARDTIFGRSDQDAEVGWRAEVVFHPFGEVQREAHQYDAEGNAIALYKTEPVVDADGQQVMQTLTDSSGKTVDVLVNQFALDEAGDRIAETVGTGQAQGPGIYLRVEDVFNGDDGLAVIGGIRFSF